MSESASSATNIAPPQSWFQRHHFLIRRLHSLSGIVPLGVFTIFHLFTNAQLAFGEAFQHEVNWIYTALPALLVLEISLWGAIAFHAALGLVYTFTKNKTNVGHYGYGGNWRWFLQRITGVIALIFIFLHIATLRWHWDIAGWHTPFMLNDKASDTPLAQASVALALENPWVVVLYIIGSLSVIFHWSNGLWTAAITWGLTLSVKSQQRWGAVCAALGVALTLFLASAIYGAVTTEVSDQERSFFQQQIEQEAQIEAGAPEAPAQP